MRVFVGEYVCGGGLRPGEATASLLREGRAMLTAVLADFSAVTDCDVVTVVDPAANVVPPDRVSVVEKTSGDSMLELWCEVAGDCDAAFVIAPEFDGILARLRAEIGEACDRVLGGDVVAVQRCSDKRRLAMRLEAVGVATIPTWSPNEGERPPFPPPWVVKPRDGAGSIGVRLVDGESGSVIESCGIVQPYVAGRAVSVGVIRDANDALALPVAEQRLSDDGRFTYLGGRVPADIEVTDAVRATALRAVACVEGLRGYVGVDLLIPDDDPERPVVVEINPRLTTSYLGYRALVDENLAERLLGRRSLAEPVRLRSGVVEFDADGTVRRPREWVRCT